MLPRWLKRTLAASACTGVVATTHSSSSSSSHLQLHSIVHAQHASGSNNNSFSSSSSISSTSRVTSFMVDPAHRQVKTNVNSSSAASSPSSSSSAAYSSVIVALRTGAPHTSLLLSAASSSDNSSSPSAPSNETATMHSLTPAQAEQCDAWKHKAIHSSRKVDYLIRSMKRLGCHFDPSLLISCIPCSPHASGGCMMDEDSVQVLMCGNGLRSWDHFETVLTHELIHAYDHCRAEIDTNDLRHHACMEVRASNLSGDCSFKREMKLGNLDVTGHQPKCVRRRATMSMMANPAIESVEQAKAIVEEVYERCAADTEPFGSVPW